MPDYLKQAAWNTPASSLTVRRRVSEMLGRIEREGEHAVRRYSVELDGWSPRSFVVAAAVRGALHCAREAVRRMPATGGAIVFVSSQMGHVGASRRSVYCATKHAVEGLTRALAVELAPRGVRVVAVAPTFVATEMTAPFLADRRFRDDVLERIPLGRLATVDEVAAAVLFAASPAAGSTTGCSLLVDGGWTAQ